MKKVSILLLFFGISGCALMQPTDPYGPANRMAYSASEHSRPAAPAKLTEEPVTLEQAIEIGLVNNPGVAARGFEADAAATRQDRALSERMPEMRVGRL